MAAEHKAELSAGVGPVVVGVVGDICRVAGGEAWRLQVSAREVDWVVAAQEDYAAAYKVAMDPATRTKPAVAGKDVARRALVAVVREVAGQIMARRW